MDYPALLENESLAKYSYYRIGGPARYFYIAKSNSDFAELLKLAKKEDLKVFVLGAGSNVLFADEGFDGLVVKNECRQIKIDGTFVKVEAGALLKDVILKAREHNLQGLENLWGLPGTIGAAVRGNAGSFGTEIGNFIKEVRILEDLKELTLDRAELEFAYRSSKLKSKGGVVLEVTLELQQVKNLPSLEEFSQKRQAKQPPGFSCGSFFQNPVGDKSAGQLIEEAGLKGLRIGGAQISEKHANFILNVDNASFADLIELKNQIQKAVKDKFGIELEPEVVIVK
ncbi:MAG: UDP-N-acetylmuramate dehydrogenase [Candidatus Gracilibacteria bacterium]|nr:UDP-N-acetylmuramate dehydrogenase [Candidatus Gracilibacteria bacterium]